MAKKNGVAKGNKFIKAKTTAQLNNSITNLPSFANRRKTRPDDADQACEACKRCICRNWRGNLTPQLIALFEGMLYSMKNNLMQNTPNTGLDLEMELYPGTGVYMKKRDILMAISRAKDNKRAMIRNLITSIYTKQEIMDFGTGEKLYKTHPDIFLAISEYLQTNIHVTVNKSLFVNVINHKIGYWKQITEDKKQKAADRNIKATMNQKKRKQIKDAVCGESSNKRREKEQTQPSPPSDDNTTLLPPKSTLSSLSDAVLPFQLKSEDDYGISLSPKSSLSPLSDAVLPFQLKSEDDYALSLSPKSTLSPLPDAVLSLQIKAEPTEVIPL